MPFFDFECKKCGTVVNHMMKWSEDMHKHIDKCEECGKKNFERLITVSNSKTRELSSEERDANDLIGHSWR